jgi:hypothetical protein
MTQGKTWTKPTLTVASIRSAQGGSFSTSDKQTTHHS